ncbi:hemoglobin-3-like [Mercenaria mercenaria]|uniref:hemoglobin-3-like n=1 Tax=Mercenaria mercenaria TaxID=6596 RepID=UPI001E1D851E|nr:hemoglobin-3-like [Mercenaria mercenaria]XP_045165152.1 hemoglobin-3-like [Mercenaria mercenaria]XP_045165153.1 hemoglobin-3-like [Mercenaria mercenaria]XP_045165154.1 hemoglobin-3-like [Mercenaria mercenaria]XP_045165155.1 hemoglobin-3-like [Mercenaria mercenaria]XP_045165156.1 hemoglobin-3-like [Mercenaria mercenaria]XP_045165157.1 hemoglobin-3-like [Mercenaria mercenaria]
MDKDMDTPDPVTGLTGREKDAVRENWNKIASSWKTNGVDFFVRLFKAYPVIRSFFKTFDGMDIEEIRKTPKLRAHAINFKHGITSFLDNLDDTDCLVVLIQKLTANHFRREIKVEQFQDAFTLFVNFAQDVSDVDELTANAWKKTLKVVASVISQHMAELEQQKMTNEQKHVTK